MTIYQNPDVQFVVAYCSEKVLSKWGVTGRGAVLLTEDVHPNHPAKWSVVYATIPEDPTIRFQESEERSPLLQEPSLGDCRERWLDGSQVLTVHADMGCETVPMLVRLVAMLVSYATHDEQTEPPDREH